MAPNVSVKYTKLFINNKWENSISGKAYPNINPCTGKKICDIQEADKADVDKAVVAARQAFKLGSVWRTMDASARGALLYKWADLLERDKDHIAALDSLENGKTVKEAQQDMAFTIKVIRYFAGAADKIHGKTLPTDGNVFSYTRRESLGVCGLILPWNVPVIMIANKLGPALATGNTVVVKPAEQTPLTCLYFANLALEAGFPPGVINVVPGFGPAGAAISSHQDIDKVSFTGSTQVGQIIQQAAASSNLKKVTLELGGKSPIVIFDDADLNAAIHVSNEAVFANQGQICFAATRTFVQEGIYDEFVKKSRERTLKIVVGDPSDKKTDQGPQIDEKQLNRILSLIEIGKKEGAKLECGGSRVGTTGYFVQPTVFSNVKDNMTIAKEEIFGPVQQILKFKTMEEVIERANDTQYGLAAGVFTKDVNKALAFTQAVRAGVVWVNCYGEFGPQNPFGGYKMSGYGRELGMDALNSYSEIKTVTMKMQQKNS